MEKYLVSDKQDKSPLANMIPGSQEARYLAALEALHSEKPYSKLPDKTRRELDDIMKEKGSQWEGVKLRILLRQFDETRDWAALRKEWERTTGENFEDIHEPGFLKDMGVRGVEAREQLPTVLQVEWKPEELLESFYATRVGLNAVHPVWRGRIDWARLTKE